MSDLKKRLPDRLRIHYNLTADEIAEEAADRIEALEECLRECADDLECELNARYPKSFRAYACMESNYRLDMSPVYKARALLEEK